MDNAPNYIVGCVIRRRSEFLRICLLCSSPFQDDVTSYGGGLGSVLPSVKTLAASDSEVVIEDYQDQLALDDDSDVRGFASGYVPNDDISVTEEYYDDTYDENYDNNDESYDNNDLNGGQSDLNTIFNPNDLSGYGEVTNDNAADDEYYYDEESDEYYYDYDIDQQPEMIDLRGSQPLVIDNYSGKRRR